MKGRQRRSASHVDDRGCVDADAAEALAGTNVIEAADLTQNAVNDVVDTLADTTVFTDRTPSTCPRCLGPTRCTTPSPRTRGPRLNRSLTTSAILAAAGAALTDVVRVGIVTRDLRPASRRPRKPQHDWETRTVRRAAAPNRVRRR